MDNQNNQDLSVQPKVPGIQESEQPKKSIKKTRLFIVIAAIIIITFALGIGRFILRTSNKPKSFTNKNYQQTIITTPSVSQSAPTISNNSNPLVDNDIKNSTLIFENEGIFLLNGLNSKPIIIDRQGSSPSYSPALSKIAYLNGFIDNDIRIYDLNSKKIEILKTNDLTIRNVAWSPDGKYLLTDSGTGTIGEGNVYEYPSVRKVATFQTINRSLDGIKWLWINNNEFVTVKHYENPNPKPIENGNIREGLSKITLPMGTEQKIIAPNGSEEYFPMMVESGVIYFKNTYLTDNSTKYWKINIDDTDKKEINQLDIPIEKINSIIKNNLPSKYVKYQLADGYELVKNHLNPNWVVFSLYNSDKKPSNEIWILNIDNPEKTIQKISTGENPSW